MPVYTYKALKEDGGSEAGVIDADSPREARNKLKHRKLFVTDLAPVGGVGPAAGGDGKRIRIPFWYRRRLQDLAIITRQVATLLASGIPMMGALSAVIEQAEDRILKATLMDVRERVAQGATFSDALELHPFYFNELYVNMVRAGEAAGTLDKVLFRLADYQQQVHRLRSRITAAMTYPIIMVIIGTIVVGVLMGYVVPKILEVIRKQGKGDALPLPTEILITVSDLVKGYWPFLIGAVAAVWIGYRILVSTPAGRLWADTVKLDLPIVGNLLRKTAISRFAVTFATLLESGLPVLESLNVVKRVVNNALLASTIDQVRQKVVEGADISTPLKASKVFPPVVGYMISVGEESGRLEELLKRVAEAYDEEVEIAAQKMTAMLEPVMIVFMAVVVGFIVLSILLPILQMSDI
jgi:general secretion pathway protein F